MKRFLVLFVMFSTQLISNNHLDQLRDWEKGKEVILHPTERKPARTAILIISAPHFDDSFTSCRWKLGKKTWEKYMNTEPDVDCYFLQTVCPRKENAEQVWIEDNTIYIGDPFYEATGRDRILHKTIVAIEKLLPNYTHFIRTNLNTFVNLKVVKEYAETHHQSLYTGPLWQGAWYVIGYGILFTADVAEHIVNEYNRLDEVGEELISPYHADDGAMTALATGIWPYNKQHPFSCCPTLPFGTRQLMCKGSLSTDRLCQYGLLLYPAPSFEKALEYCSQALNTVMLYRIRHGFELIKQAEIYEYLIHNIYPELTDPNLVEYAKSLPVNRM